MKNKTSLIALLTAFAAFIAFPALASAQVDSGASAPDFTLADTNGVEHSLSDFAGSYVVLEWTNHQCPFVVKHYADGHMQALQEQYTDAGVVWLQIVSSAEGKQGYVTASQGNDLAESEGHGATAMLLDPTGDVGRMYAARTTPHMYIIDPAGTLIYQGAIDSIRSARTSDVERADNYVALVLDAVMAGDDAPFTNTQPYGCSVKY